jgi:hypothetical protein
MNHVKAYDLKNRACEKLSQRINAEGLPKNLVEEIRKIGWQINDQINDQINLEIVGKSVLKVGEKFPHYNSQSSTGVFTIKAHTELDCDNDWCEYVVIEGRVTKVAAQEEIGQERMLQTGIRQKIADYLKIEATSTFHLAFDESIYQGWVE